MKIVIEKDTLVQLFTLVLYPIVGGDYNNVKTTVTDLVEAINYTPLPTGHGRLIDADALKMDERVCGGRYLSGSPLFVANKVIEQAPTIIEADEGKENG